MGFTRGLGVGGVSGRRSRITRGMSVKGLWGKGRDVKGLADREGTECWGWGEGW